MTSYLTLMDRFTTLKGLKLFCLYDCEDRQQQRGFRLIDIKPNGPLVTYPEAVHALREYLRYDAEGVPGRQADGIAVVFETPEEERPYVEIFAWLKVRSFVKRPSVEAETSESDDGQSSPGTSHKRAFVMLDDVYAAIHEYAEMQQIPIKDVVDRAFRIFFEQQAPELLRKYAEA